jgi:hypothetical protein
MEAIMPSRIPPVPPSNTRDQDTQGRAEAAARTDKVATEAKVRGHDPRERNTDQQGRQANIKQNTTNQGHQRDR